MPEVLIFVLGALFCLTLVVAVVALVGPGAPAVAGAGGADLMQASRAGLGTGSATRHGQTTRPSHPDAGRGTARSDSRRKAPGAARPGPRPMAYLHAASRLDRRLDIARRALAQIAADRSESQPAKIASQTLRRLDVASESPAERIAFAEARLRLLALGAHPRARMTAEAALATID